MIPLPVRRLYRRVAGGETPEDRIWRKMVEAHPEIEHLVLSVATHPEQRGEQPTGWGRRWRARWLPGRRFLDVLRRWP